MIGVRRAARQQDRVELAGRNVLDRAVNLDLPGLFAMLDALDFPRF